MIQDILNENRKKMDGCIVFFRKALSAIRTGRASTSLVENLKVDYYGNQTLLNQMASLSIPESSTISIQPWDTSAIQCIEKAILVSDLGLNPANDGKVIRLSIPPLTADRRKQLVKIVKKESEECKVSIRNVRRDSMEHFKKIEKEKPISKDDLKKAQDEIQKETDKFIKQVDDITALKEKEILEG